MGLKSFFHKIKIAFIRHTQPALPFTSQAKKHGNIGEARFADLLKDLVPDCQIKQNILISSDSHAEIDFLILYQSKLFAVEVKHWKGHIYEDGLRFLQCKTDRWTGECHQKTLGSPFKQLNRAVYLLRKQIPADIWINKIVFFEDADEVFIQSEANWFLDIDSLAHYIRNSGKPSPAHSAKLFFQQCIAADCLFDHYGNSLQCVLSGSFLNALADYGILRSQISNIFVHHHWSFDRFVITLKNHSVQTIDLENETIHAIVNGQIYTYGLSKIDRIIFS